MEMKKRIAGSQSRRASHVVLTITRPPRPHFRREHIHQRRQRSCITACQPNNHQKRETQYFGKPWM